MKIELDESKELPLYEQLKQGIVEGIALGELHPGEKLPSVRALAAQLSVNMHTIAKAYGQLRDEGFLTVQRKRGVVVNTPEKYCAKNEYIEELTESLRTLALEATCRGVDLRQWLELCGKVYY